MVLPLVCYCVVLISAGAFYDPAGWWKSSRLETAAAIRAWIRCAERRAILAVMDSKSLVRQALALAPAKRAELAHALLLSLGGLSESQVQTAWLDDAQRRAQQLDAGTESPISADAVRRDAHALLR